MRGDHLQNVALDRVGIGAAVVDEDHTVNRMVDGGDQRNSAAQNALPRSVDGHDHANRRALTHFGHRDRRRRIAATGLRKKLRPRVKRRLMRYDSVIVLPGFPEMRVGSSNQNRATFGSRYTSVLAATNG